MVLITRINEFKKTECLCNRTFGYKISLQALKVRACPVHVFENVA